MSDLPALNIKHITYNMNKKHMLILRLPVV